MWNSSYIQRGASHYWHGQYTFKIYQELGFVAARVTSKLLGIGSCERAWGDTKHVRQGKRCSLSAEKLEMQSILFTASCIQKARYKTNYTKEHYWGPEDLESLSFEKELAESTWQDLMKLKGNLHP